MHVSEHHATVDWQRGTADFEYETYPRDHMWAFHGGITVEASAAPAFRGTPERVDPEDAFVASIASCHMLTFLALAARKGMVVNNYRDEAVGVLEKNEDGKLAITRVTLKPRISFEEDPSEAELERLHDKAHHGCFIANSVRTTVTVEPG